MSVRISVAMMLLAGLTACASTSARPLGQQAAVIQTDSTVGHKIDDAIAANGPATLQWDLPDGRRAYQWQQASIEARVGPATANNGAMVGAASQTTCYYTLYTKPDAKGLWTVVGYEQPRPGCGRLAMNGTAR